MLELMRKRKKRALYVMMNADAPYEVRDRAATKLIGLTRSLRARTKEGTSYVVQ